MLILKYSNSLPCATESKSSHWGVFSYPHIYGNLSKFSDQIMSDLQLVWAVPGWKCRHKWIEFIIASSLTPSDPYNYEVSVPALVHTSRNTSKWHFRFWSCQRVEKCFHICTYVTCSTCTWWPNMCIYSFFSWFVDAMTTFTRSSRRLEYFEVSRVFLLTNDLAGFFLTSS